MGLFDKGTAILLGAGASVPFGLPNGLTMLDQAVVELEAEARTLEGIAAQNPFRAILVNRTPISYAWRFDGDATEMLNPNEGSSQLRSKAEWLSKQTFDTIDDVIRHFPSEANLLKILAAKILFDKIYQFNADEILFPRNELLQRKLGVRSGDGPRNWIHHLINLAKAELLEDPNIWGLSQRVKIITFNYDDILERVLDFSWSSSEAIKQLSGDLGKDVSDWREIFEIVHPHGVLPRPKERISRREFPAFLVSAAQEIVVVRDPAPEAAGINKARSRAREICEGANMIYAMGFAFARSNCDLLGLCRDGKDHAGDQERDQEVHYLNFSGETGLRGRVQRLESPEFPFNTDIRPGGMRRAVEYRDEKGGKLHIDQALMAGFLGEMPS